MAIIPPSRVARFLATLATDDVECPCCAVGKDGLFPSEHGPELSDGPVDDPDREAAFMTHVVYCGKEDRNLAVVYRPSQPLPECAECESSFDVIADPPPRHFKLTAAFEYSRSASAPSAASRTGSSGLSSTTRAWGAEPSP